MTRVLGIPRATVAARRESGSELRRNSSLGLVLQRRDSPGAHVDAIKYAADRASNDLRELALAVSVWNSDPTAGSVQTVEAKASAVRQDVIKMRHLRDTIPPSNSTAHRIAQTQLDRVRRQYFDLLTSLTADTERATEAMERRDAVQLPVKGLFQEQEWAEYTDEQRRHVSDARARNVEIRQIEKSVRTIHAMMQELQGLVLENSANLAAVDSNMEQARGEIVQGWVNLGLAKRLKERVRRRKLLVSSVIGEVVLGGAILLTIVLLV